MNYVGEFHSCFNKVQKKCLTWWCAFPSHICLFSFRPASDVILNLLEEVNKKRKAVNKEEQWQPHDDSNGHLHHYKSFRLATHFCFSAQQIRPAK